MRKRRLLVKIMVILLAVTATLGLSGCEKEKADKQEESLVEVETEPIENSDDSIAKDESNSGVEDSTTDGADNVEIEENVVVDEPVVDETPESNETVPEDLESEEGSEVIPEDIESDNTQSENEKPQDENPEEVEEETPTPEEKEDSKDSSESVSEDSKPEKNEDTDAEVNTQPAGPHVCTWDAGTVTSPATCYASGIKTYTCSGCQNTRTETIAQLTHNYVTTVTPATCTASGATTTTCSYCQDSKSETIAQLSHNYVTTSTAATCTEAGKSYDKCSSCGDIINEVVTSEALGHDYQRYFPLSTPTCLGGAYYNMKCSRCGAIDPNGDGMAEALPHTPGEGVIVRVGHCNSYTIVKYYCIYCGLECGEDKYYTDEHNWIVVSGTTWSDEAMAFVEYSFTKCSRCGKNLEE